jgi:hypothetical protein
MQIYNMTIDNGKYKFIYTYKGVSFTFEGTTKEFEFELVQNYLNGKAVVEI